MLCRNGQNLSLVFYRKMSFFIRKGGTGGKNSLAGKKRKSFQDGNKGPTRGKKFKANKVNGGICLGYKLMFFCVHMYIL